jgi:5-methylcytosine-specific restriction endonuclease McrA
MSIRKPISWRIRGAVMALSWHSSDRAFLCSYCMCRMSHEDVVIDHIMPVAKGGGNDVENLTVSCHTCNSIKSDNLPDDAENLIHAHWDAHFGDVVIQ